MSTPGLAFAAAQRARRGVVSNDIGGTAPPTPPVHPLTPADLPLRSAPVDPHPSAPTPPASSPEDQAAVLLSFVRQGCGVFRLADNSKVPEKGSRGFKDAIRDEAEIRRRVNDSPRGNWGVVPGECVFVLDLDVKRGKNGIARFQRWCEERSLNFTALTTTGLVVRTASGGLHVYLRASGPMKQGTNVLGEGKEHTGIDTRTADGYVVAPGSVVDGRPYAFLSNADMLPAPRALVEALSAGCTPSEKPESPESVEKPTRPIDPVQALERVTHYLTQEATPAIEGHGGDEQTYKTACRCKDLGTNLETTKALMWTVYNPRCQPPWVRADLDRKIESAYRNGQNSVGSAAPEAEFSLVSAEPVAQLDPRAPWLEEMNARHAVVSHGREVVVYRSVDDPILRRKKYHKYPFASFQQLYQNDRVPVVQDSGRVVKQNKGAAWLAHPLRRQYLGGVCYAPGRTLPADLLNLDMGFGLEPKPGRWPLMRAHLLHVICGGDEQVFRYVMGWLATAVQRRGDRAGVALVLRGNRGVGKGILGNTMVRILGQHGIYLSSSEHLVGKFNGHLEDASFVFGDECFFPYDKAHLSRLKSLITEPDITIEEKFQSARTARNCLHILLASNEQFVVPAGHDERRYCVLDVSEAHKQDGRYFTPLRQELGLDSDTDGQGTGAAAMLYELVHYDLSGFDIMRVPKTEALLEQKLDGMSTVQKWVFDGLQQGAFSSVDCGASTWETGSLSVQTRSLYEGYLVYSKQSREYRPEESGPWMKEIKKMLGSSVSGVRPWTKGGDRPRIVIFKPLPECRSAFERWIGHSVKWEPESGDEETLADELEDPFS